MVVNESMAAGVPVICSSGVGAAQDLIRNGKSGLIFQKGNAQELATAIETMLSSEKLRKDMVVEADKILDDYTVEKARDQFLYAIDMTYSYAKNK
jgi:phosphatidylinositol alpha-mannosyltransferase